MLMSVKNGTFTFVRYDSGNPTYATGSLLKVERVSNRFVVTTVQACKVMQSIGIDAKTGLTFTNYNANATVGSNLFTWCLFIAVPQ